MLILLWFAQVVTALIGTAGTFIPLWASYKGMNMWGWEWQIWAMIGFGLFAVATYSLVFRMWWLWRGLNTEDAKRRRRIEKDQESQIPNTGLIWPDKDKSENSK